MDKIKVSILVPAYNVEAYLDECLQSLLSQTLKEIEIVLVDDGSSDRTATIAEQYAASDSRIRVIRLPEHEGVSHARNVCLAEAQGEYLSFVDSDDTITPTAMEELYHKAKTTDADIVLGSMLYCYPDGKRIRVGDKSCVFRSDNEILSGQECFIRMQQTGCYVPMVCSNLYRTDFIKEHPQLHFEGEFHEDEYFTPFALYEATRVTDFKKDFYLYRQREESIMHSCNNIKQRAEALCFVSKELKTFAKERCKKMDNILRGTFEKYSEHLSYRSQNLYEQELYHSDKKCLFIFTGVSIAAKFGIGTYISQLVQCFDSTIWDVQVVTLYKTAPKIEFSIEKGIAWYYIPLSNNQNFNPESIYKEEYNKSIFYYLASRINKGRKIFCHFNFFYHKQLAIQFKEQLQAYIVYTLHCTNWSFELLGDKERLKSLLSEPDNTTKRAFEKEREFMQNCCDKIIAIAQHSYEMLIDLYGMHPSKVVKIPNALSDNFNGKINLNKNGIRKKYKYIENEKLIIFAGRLEKVKGIMELIDAFKDIVESIPDARLIIAGSGDFNHCLEKARPYSKYITFTGYLSKEQLYELYFIADVGVIPSIHEEFGYVAIEMMLNKLPVIVHKTTGLAEITNNGKYGETFNFSKRREDVSSLTDAIIKVLKKRPTENQLKERRNWVLKNYSIPIFRKRILSVYACMENPCSN